MKALEDYLKKHKKTDIIFDFDATIIKLLIPWGRIFDEIREELRKIDREIIEDYDAGRIGDVGAQNKYLANHGAVVRDLLLEHMKKFEKNNLSGVKLNQELIDFIRNDDKYRKYLWSSNTRGVLEPLLKEHGMLHKFETLVTRDMVNILKPYTHGFDFIHDKKKPMSDYLFVGDSENDEGAAKKLGMDFFKVSF